MSQRTFYPSISKILSATETEEKRESLARWRAEVGEEEAERIRSEAMARGRQYDHYVQLFIQGKPIPHHGLQAHLSKFEILKTEQNVVSHRYKYNGRYDAIFQHGDHKIINDFKGSSKPKKSEWIEDYWLQIAAYWIALDEVGEKMDYGMITIILPDRVQRFVMRPEQFQIYREKFIQRVHEYYAKFASRA